MVHSDTDSIITNSESSCSEHEIDAIVENYVENCEVEHHESEEELDFDAQLKQLMASKHVVKAEETKKTVKPFAESLKSRSRAPVGKRGGIVRSRKTF